MKQQFMTCSKDISTIKELASIFKKGGVAIVPTDTVYGFSGIVDDSSENQMRTDDRIRQIKGRSETKPLIQLIADPSDIEKYSAVPIPQKLYSKWPGSLTIIVPLKSHVFVAGALSSVAFRCPGDQWLRSLIAECGKPLYSTSVNRSGCPVIERISEIKSEFEAEVDFIVDDGDRLGSVASTIVRLDSDGSYEVLRQGSLIV